MLSGLNRISQQWPTHANQVSVSGGSVLLEGFTSCLVAQPSAPVTQLVSLRLFGSHPSAPAELPLQRLEEAVVPGVTARLDSHGFAVVDGVFGSKCASALRNEVALLRRAGHMRLNSTHLVRDGGATLLQKRGVYEAELLEPETQAAAPLLAQLQADATLRTLLSVYLPQHTLVSQAIKAQLNEGGGACFPMHFDSDESVDGRRLSAIVYLNEGWKPADGGALRLFPFAAAPVDVAPLHDRLVLFASTRTLHRVMPAHAERACFTIWFTDAARQRRITAPPDGPTELLRSALAVAAEAGGELPPEAAAQLLAQPEVQKLAAKLHYADQWAASIEDSHDDGDSRRGALQQFWADLEIIRRVLRPLEPALRGAFPSGDAAEPVLLM